MRYSGRANPTVTIDNNRPSTGDGVKDRTLCYTSSALYSTSHGKPPSAPITWEQPFLFSIPTSQSLLETRL
ncbi:MAG: hypothetical protein AUJ07_10320 [Crenarchaeota archaeon 13_1_40CM_3_53_5]|nr:MAG: hypothetical protein AUJ07_10320 [Crenarchaeota archaeon 13_1_40CM_3_53_5]